MYSIEWQKKKRRLGKKGCAYITDVPIPKDALRDTASLRAYLLNFVGNLSDGDLLVRVNTTKKTGEMHALELLYLRHTQWSAAIDARHAEVMKRAEALKDSAMKTLERIKLSAVNLDTYGVPDSTKH